jgi:type 1 glutamine amidotransferase
VRSSKRLFTVLLLLLLATQLGGCSLYQFYRLTFPSRTYETDRVELPTELSRPAVLLFTKTNGFRHDEAIEAGIPLYEAIAARRGWSLLQTESGAVFNAEDLPRFDVVVWHNVSGDVLNEEQKRVFRAWLEQGGGFVGVHGTGGDSSYDWEWFVEEWLGAQFIGHVFGPQFQDATLLVEDRNHPATAHLPETFVWNEEWYSFDRSVREREGYRVLVSVDEASYSPRYRLLGTDRDISMGDHPVVWTHCVDRGRAFFSALGHQEQAYSLPEHQKLLEGAVAWAMRAEGSGCD